MKRTSPVILLLVALAGAAAGVLVDHALTSAGRATFTPAVALPILLVLLGAGLLVMAWQIRRSVRATGENRRRVNPFRALRTAVLARASSLAGAALAGFAAGLLGYLLSRPVPPPVGSAVAIVAALVGAVVLVIAALVAESFCTLPNDPDASAEAGTEDDDDDHTGTAAPAAR
ncbi:hypothetical protein GCM10025768_26150 [Microbacterium pseudoresistens]|uniref:Membrane protease YdiL (CAAX protease family) n=1 Tax=Microbacterium pseudoresistens TaxID=640634 RepID=A0A7Y9ETL9_9MICO|nr:DUF3180 domain-containing protein [Microbacterium pseudoresistens]NYD53728.1 membrane protease YdiL (CAAX protease family) [Microbacterium pseudoresistens]